MDASAAATPRLRVVASAMTYGRSGPVVDFAAGQAAR